MRVRAAVAIALATSALSAVPAQAAATTHLVAHLTPATALVGSLATVTGSVSPAGKSTIMLERYVNRQWHVVASQKPLAGKTFLFHVRASKAVSTLPLRVVRGTAVSPTLHLTSVKTAYSVTATVVDQTVTGTVRPKAKGSVQLQLLDGRIWTPLASAKLTATSTYAITLTRPAGTYRLRVVKTFSSTVAAGTGKAFTLVVAAPPAVVPPPVVTTAAVPAARVAVPYSATLTASGGTAPLTWSATSLPAGLTVSPAGLLTGTPTTAGTAVMTVTATDAAGRTGTAVLTLAVAPRAGRLYSWGYDFYGQLGNGVVGVDANVISPVTGMTSITAMAETLSNTYAVRSDGAVFAWGSNAGGQLGTGHTDAGSASPVQVSGIDSVTAVAGGDSVAYALRADGTVWSWGINNDGQLGNNTLDPGVVPAPVSTLSGIVAIAGGYRTGYALKSDGTVWGWGYNSDGEIGDGTNTQQNSPTQVSGLTGVVAIASGQAVGYALKADGTVWAWGNGGVGGLGNGNGTFANSNVPVQVVGLSTAVAIAGGASGGYALLANGTVWAWGLAANGALGNGMGGGNALVPVQVLNLTGVVSISAGFAQGYALLPDGTARAWGFDGSGELGDGKPAAQSLVPVAVSGVTTGFLIAGGNNADTGLILQAG